MKPLFSRKVVCLPTIAYSDYSVQQVRTWVEFILYTKLAKPSFAVEE